MRSVQALVAGLIDYAGLFPPAGLDMSAAVDNYARYFDGDLAWALGRFVVPTARLREFEEAFAPVSLAHPWSLSALAGPELVADLAEISWFNQRNDGRALIDSIETKASTADEISRTRELVDRAYEWFVEVPIGDPALLDSVALADARAKVRMGGLSADMFPSPEKVAAFLLGCAQHNVAFKATAGLHHPVRCHKAFTYERSSPSGNMHGFFNVLLAAALARRGATVELLTRILQETDSSAFTFSDAGVNWRGEHMTTSELSDMRSQAALSFGSCSFDEPIEDLRNLKVL
ncbi:MAG TPA: hypothetical protein VN622_04045 [Clostridia bacterium]|nr:hypothetical protein [Clostridia bacterium]